MRLSKKALIIFDGSICASDPSLTKIYLNVCASNFDNSAPAQSWDRKLRNTQNTSTTCSWPIMFLTIFWLFSSLLLLIFIFIATVCAIVTKLLRLWHVWHEFTNNALQCTFLQFQLKNTYAYELRLWFLRGDWNDKKLFGNNFVKLKILFFQTLMELPHCRKRFTKFMDTFTKIYTQRFPDSHIHNL